MTIELIVEPELDKPGAGLPFYEWAIAKYLIFPHRFRTTSKEQAIQDFELESEKILQLARLLDESMIGKRKLIKRLRGLEDSSRYWSVAMAIEHLIIVGTSMRGIILSLSNGETNLPESKIANLKPDPQVSSDGLLQRFEQMTQKFVRTARSANVDAHPQALYSHPWFGPLDARKWLAFSAPHQKVHRMQIEEIVRLIKTTQQS